MKMTNRISLIILVTVLGQLSLEALTYIQAGKMFDGESGSIASNVTIIVDGDEIKSIENGFVSGDLEKDTLIQLHDHTVLPGLIDLHTHLSIEYSPNTSSERLFLNPADYALRASEYAERTLLAGFTTVRDLGDRYNLTVALKKAISNGWIEGPRIFTSTKSIATTGGHADPTNGICYHLMGSPDPSEGVINGPMEARHAVRKRYKDGADCIKITATGGVLSLASSGDNAQFMEDELEAIVETARDYNLTVAVHAHGDEGMRRAVLAGVDSIEHGTFMSLETMQLMKERGTLYIPTISAGKWVAEKAEVEGFLPEVVRPKARSVGPQIQNTFAKAYAEGVKIGFGTDTGVSAHGDNAKEFAYMVEAGMPAEEALRCATGIAAKFLRKEDSFGTLKAGLLADIIAVKGNPLEDISIMEDVRFVMKEGTVYKQD